MSKELKIEWRDVPLSCQLMAQRRTSDMVSHYGRNIRSMPIETLAESIYLQGVEDTMNFYEKKTEKPNVGGKDGIPLAMEAGVLGSGSI